GGGWWSPVLFFALEWEEESEEEALEEEEAALQRRREDEDADRRRRKNAEARLIIMLYSQRSLYQRKPVQGTAMPMTILADSAYACHTFVPPAYKDTIAARCPRKTRFNSLHRERAFDPHVEPFYMHTPDVPMCQQAEGVEHRGFQSAGQLGSVIHKHHPALTLVCAPEPAHHLATGSQHRISVSASPSANASCSKEDHQLLDTPMALHGHLRHVLLQLQPCTQGTQMVADMAAPDMFAYSNLVQELLLALVGFTGDVFVDSASYRARLGETCQGVPHPDGCHISVSPDLSWVEAGDREVLGRLVQLGFHYKAVQAFVDAQQPGAAWLTPYCPSGLSPGTAPQPHDVLHGQGIGAGLQAAGVVAATPAFSLYRRALASGLTEALDVYVACVVELQRKAQAAAAGQAPPLVLAAITMHLHEFAVSERWSIWVLLPHLHLLAYRAAGGAPHPSASSTSLEQALPLSLPTSLAYGSVQPGVGAAGAAGGTGEGKGGLPLRGAQLLVLVAEAARSGAPAWSACAQRLLWHCHQVLFRQLASWMIHGVLLDPHAEFFVASASGSTPGTQAASSTTDGFDWQTSY
ncbi:hypothetical protein QJQ45_021384, partial [Haematococcus lacustris]